MTVFCTRCNSNTHAEEWHSFAYRRWYIHLRRAFKNGTLEEAFLKGENTQKSPAKERTMG